MTQTVLKKTRMMKNYQKNKKIKNKNKEKDDKDWSHIFLITKLASYIASSRRRHEVCWFGLE